MAPDLMRLVTAGSVDDGKSTLVGRLLYDTMSVLSDQLDAVLRTSMDRGQSDPDLALLVDGLRAEREQGITIDVAYRYFETSRRMFVLADTPGHVQYTRNTVTGASTAEHAVLLTDARKGVLPQTKRHLVVMALLGVPTLTIAVNKLDLVDFAEDVFTAVRDEFLACVEAVGYPAGAVAAVPVSALSGDNVVTRSARTPWFDGPTLLERLETVQPVRTEGAGLRLPVQYVIWNPLDGYRGYAGQVAAGSVSAGDEVVVLPAGMRTEVERIDTPDGPVPTAVAGAAVSLILRDELDVSRGDLVAAASQPPSTVQELDAAVCWFTDRPLRPGAKLLLRHATRTVMAQVVDVQSRFDELELTDVPGIGELRLNEIGRVLVRVAEPLPVDDYADCRSTGAFLLIDDSSGDTLGAGMLGVRLPARPPSVPAA
jgi:sulfate adenylyltransferase subunit 1